jgi:nucleoside-diphosphate-sugar epimerase
MRQRPAEEMEMGHPLNLFVFGAGYSGTAIALELRPDAASTSGTGRSPASLDALRASGVAPFRFHGDCVPGGVTSAPSDGMTSAPSGGVTSALADGLTNALREATHVVTTIAPNEAGDPVLRCLRDTLLHRMPALQWIGYLSTTGVYGDHGGDWVDESSPCWPDTGRAIRRLAVEQEWQEVADRRDTPLAVLRLSGIYGPGRNAIVSVADGTARRIVRPGQWFNRIHVEDIAGATAMLARRATAGIFNISDDAPAPPRTSSSTPPHSSVSSRRPRPRWTAPASHAPCAPSTPRTSACPTHASPRWGTRSGTPTIALDSMPCGARTAGARPSQRRDVHE